MGRKLDKRFDPTDFTGIVQLKQYAPFPDGRQYIGVAGQVSVIKDEEMIGFEVRGGETANWLLRVDGPTGSINILGCQVRMVHQFDGAMPDSLDTSYYRVP
jgi:hypothetical protein